MILPVYNNGMRQGVLLLKMKIKTSSSIGRKCYRDVALCVSLLISDVLYMLLWNKQMRSSIGPAGINLTFTMFKMQVLPVLLSLVYPKALSRGYSWFSSFAYRNRNFQLKRNCFQKHEPLTCLKWEALISDAEKFLAMRIPLNEL